MDAALERLEGRQISSSTDNASSVDAVRKVFSANPSPKGRGCREAAGEGYQKIFFIVFRFCTPH
jgi:hypothetical protein